jgi:uncharacterized SAM-binding protein YcdF (DUF218 family)
MGDAIAFLVKAYLVPGSPSFLLLGLTAGVLLLLGPRRVRRVGVVALALLTAMYWVLSVPAVAELLATRFHAAPPPFDPTPHRGHHDAVLVLGAGVMSHRLHGYDTSVPDRQTVFNAFEGARLSHLLGDQVPVVASGGVVNSELQTTPESEVIRDLLVRAGVPASQIVLESASRTTRDQAVNVAPLIAQRQWLHVFLVTPSAQMPRAMASFAKEGATSLIAADTPLGTDAAGDGGVSRWLPSGDALGVSARAAYDYLAWLYYWGRGWI